MELQVEWRHYNAGNVLFCAFSSDFLQQVHILGVGLAVHEKLVHPEMRPLHKKLVDQFHMMRTGLHHVSGPTCGSMFHVSVSVLFLLTHRHLCRGCCSMFMCKCFNAQCKYSEQYMVGTQQVPGVDRFGPAGCPGVNSPRGILSSHSHMSPESVRLIHRHRSVTHMRDR